ncbi:uncharacterized protein LOC110441758 [Mizuhopecten yessoensis]|uniref:uncharacterized protein LOC110441758 n=1 Tax=Mizuhopecten yessoensis TaxID=6573 RepID=UPI000B45F067|nr:uncharacterized protein LOC110441758 [Mizuhopecten yessoensis]
MSPILMCMLIGALVGVSVSESGNEHHCYSCFHVASPHDCGTIEQCPHGKECFATQYTGPDSKTFYHLGCANHGTCTHTASFHPHTHGWHHPYTFEEVLCGHCCSTPGCNMNTCDPSS